MFTGTQAFAVSSNRTREASTGHCLHLSVGQDVALIEDREQLVEGRYGREVWGRESEIGDVRRKLRVVLMTQHRDSGSLPIVLVVEDRGGRRPACDVRGELDLGQLRNVDTDVVEHVGGVSERAADLRVLKQCPRAGAEQQGIRCGRLPLTRFFELVDCREALTDRVHGCRRKRDGASSAGLGLRLPVRGAVANGDGAVHDDEKVLLIGSSMNELWITSAAASPGRRAPPVMTSRICSGCPSEWGPELPIRLTGQL